MIWVDTDGCESVSQYCKYFLTSVTKNLAGGHAHRTLFESLDLTVTPGDVVGVVGANGAGKTTLLRILAGDLDPLDGTVVASPSDAFVGWLPQEHERVAGETVSQYVARRTGAAAAAAEMERAAAELGEQDSPPAAGDNYAHRLDHWLASGAPDLDERLPPMLADLGLDVGPDALMTSLSGGQAATSPPTTSTSPDWNGWRGSCTGYALGSCWSPTTVSSSPGS